MSHPLGPDGPAVKNKADRGCKVEPDAFEVVTVRMVVPKGWGGHYAGRITQRHDLAHTALQITGYVEPIEPEEWEGVKWEAEFVSQQLDIGEWVEIKDDRYENEINDMMPDFVKVTIGQVIGIRWGWSTPYLVAVPLPAKEKDGTEWLLCEEKSPWIGYYYSWHDLRRLKLDEIPEAYRASARQRPDEPPFTPEQLAEQERITEEIISEIKAEEKKYPGESMHERNARLRRERRV